MGRGDRVAAPNSDSGTSGAADGFAAGLALLADDLRGLRRRRGQPSLRAIAARTPQGWNLSVAGASDIFNGNRLPRLDSLITLVRVLLSFDEDGQPLRTGHTGAVFTLAFSPGSTLLATAGSDGNGRLWDPATRGLLAEPLTGRGRDGWVDTVGFSPDGSLLITAGRGGTLSRWAIGTP